MKNCPAGQYESADASCQLCMVGCEFCEKLETCQQCSANLILTATGLCVCTGRQYQNGAECIECPDKCESCSAQGCSQCEEGYMVIDDGTCDVFSC